MASSGDSGSKSAFDFLGELQKRPNALEKQTGKRKRKKYSLSPLATLTLILTLIYTKQKGSILRRSAILYLRFIIPAVLIIGVTAFLSFSHPTASVLIPDVGDRAFYTTGESNFNNECAGGLCQHTYIFSRYRELPTLTTWTEPGYLLMALVLPPISAVQSVLGILHISAPHDWLNGVQYDYYWSLIGKGHVDQNLPILLPFVVIGWLLILLPLGILFFLLADMRVAHIELMQQIQEAIEEEKLQKSINRDLDRQMARDYPELFQEDYF